MSIASTSTQTKRIHCWVFVRHAIVPLLFLALTLFHPESLWAQDAASQLQTKATSAVAWVKTAVYFILIVSVIGAGVMAAFGRLSWETVGRVLIGCVVSGLATEAVIALYGGPTGGTP